MPHFVNCSRPWLMPVWLSLAVAANAQTNLPDRADAMFAGTYAASVQTSSRARTQQMGQLLFGAPRQALSGAIQLVMRFDGPAVSARITGTGGVQPGTLSGLVSSGVCRLSDERQTIVYEGPCGRQGFSGRISSTETSRVRVTGSFDMELKSVADGAETERQQQVEAQERRADVQADKVEQARAFLALKGQAEAGQVQAMRDLADAYADGAGTRADPAAAATWWARAIDRGDGWSAYRLGMVQLRSAIDRQDTPTARQALRLFERCARASPASMPKMQGAFPAEAVCELMAGTVAGFGVAGLATDVPTATRWLSTCARRGMAQCSERLRALSQ